MSLRVFLLLLLVAVLLVPTASYAWHPAPHSRNVFAASPSPAYPERGQAVNITMQVYDDTQIENVTLVYCRVQYYACAPALNMSHGTAGTFRATIPWTPRFFAGVTLVGFRMDIEYRNGTLERTPLDDWHERPDELPKDTPDVYYYYGLPEPDRASGSLAAPLTLLVLMFVAWRRR